LKHIFTVSALTSQKAQTVSLRSCIGKSPTTFFAFEQCVPKIVIFEENEIEMNNESS